MVLLSSVWLKIGFIIYTHIHTHTIWIYSFGRRLKTPRSHPCIMTRNGLETGVLCSVIVLMGLYIYHGHPRESSRRRSSHEQAPARLSQQETRERTRNTELTARSIWNTQRLAYDADLGAEFGRLLTESVSNDDPRVVNLVTTLLDPPSRHVRRKTVHNLFQTPQAKVIDDLFHQQVNKEGLSDELYWMKIYSNDFRHRYVDDISYSSHNC